MAALYTANFSNRSVNEYVAVLHFNQRYLEATGMKNPGVLRCVSSVYVDNQDTKDHNAAEVYSVADQLSTKFAAPCHAKSTDKTMLRSARRISLAFQCHCSLSFA